MIIEILYPEIGNLFGDLANPKYLEKCTNAKVIETSLEDKPYFLTNNVDIVYMGSMMESHQELVINKLKKYKKEIEKRIDEKGIFIITGNAVEIFGNYILDGNRKIDALGIFNFYSKRDFSIHHASHFIGEFNDIKIVGHKSQFSHSYGESNFIKRINGYGFDGTKSEYEGVNKNNFYGTYLVGPFLIQNPLMVKYILDLTNKKYKLFDEEDIIKSYERRLGEYTDLRMKFYN